MDTISFHGGTPIESAAKELCSAAMARGRPVAGRFNGILLTASPADNPQEVVSRYDREADARAAAYRASSEGQAEESRRERERQSLQSEHDRLVSALPRLDFTNRVAVLDWLCALQPASDRIGVTVKRDTIIAAFWAKGFVAGVNCGADYREDDPDNAFRYLVGQALDGLKNGPAIHGILHKFVADWKAKFSMTAT
jgi:hypothetical protein